MLRAALTLLVLCASAALAAKCPKWCEKHKSDWQAKCGWTGCKDCKVCGEPQQAVGACGYNCDKSPAEWENKCYWDACSGCKECAPPCQPWCAALPHPPQVHRA